VSSSTEQIQILYEIAMSIGGGLDLQRMLKDALSTMLKKLNCAAGGVYFLKKGAGENLSLERVYTTPRHADRNKTYQIALQNLPVLTDIDQWTNFSQSLPISGQSQAGNFFYLLKLPDIGLLILIKNGQALDSFIVKSLKPLLSKLADACQACLQNEELEKVHEDAIVVNLELSQKSLELQKSRSDLLNTLQELRQVAVRNRAILDAIPDLMFYLNRNGEVLDYKIMNQTDLSPEVATKIMVGGNVRSMLPPDAADLTLDYINEALVSRKMQVFEYQLEGRYHFETRLVISGPQEVLAIVRDITSRKQAEASLQTALSRTEALYRASHSMIAFEDLPNLLQTVVDNVAMALPADRVVLIMFDLVQQQVIHFVKGGPGVHLVIQPSINELWEGLTGWALRELKPVLSPKDTPDPRETPAVQQRRRETECGAIIVVPLHYGDEIIGTMTAINRPDEPDFTEQDVELMMTLGNQIVIAIANARLIESLRESEEKLSSTIASMDDQVFVLDKSGIIIAYHQPPDRADLSVPPETFLGQPFKQVFPLQMKEPLEAAINTVMATHTVQQFDYPLEIADKEMWFSAKVSMRKDNAGKFAGVTLVARDITERYELDKMRDEFVSTISHELRTPLASIMGFIDTILSGRPGPLTDVQQRFLQNSYRSSERLLKLIEEILVVSRIQQGTLKLDKHPFSPLQAIQNVQDIIAPLANTKSIWLEIQNEWPAQEQFLGDQERLEQVMINLIGNSIKFTPEQGRVWVHSYRQDDKWRFEVQDTGIGIPKADIPRLFQRFYRAGNATESQIQGTGLGLYVCKAIVERHGGQIGLESELGQGTTVWFTLPIYV